MHRKLQGFTLLELMIALTIFALIGMGAHAMLQSVLKAREVEQQHALRLVQLQKAMWFMMQDVSQMEPKTLAILEKNYTASFMRRGWNNPLALVRSDMLQVAYGLDGPSLKRYYWLPDQDDAPPQTQLLLEGVTDFSLRPLPPRAVEITLTVKNFGALRRVIEVSEP